MSISLSVLKGITWIVGFVIIVVEEHFASACILVLFVAFQSLLIFVVLVLLDSTQVKETIKNWWKAKISASAVLS